MRYFPKKNRRSRLPTSSINGSIKNSPRNRMISSMRTSICAQKKWLARAAANHLSSSPARLPRRNEVKSKEHRLKSVLLGCKGAAAAAVPRRVRILKDESLAHECLFVLERRAVQVQKTFRVHEDARAVLLKNLVAVARLCVKPHGVGQTRAPAALHANAQAAPFGRDAFLFEQRADLPRSALGQVDLRDVRANDICCHALRLRTQVPPAVPSNGAAFVVRAGELRNRYAAQAIAPRTAGLVRGPLGGHNF